MKIAVAVCFCVVAASALLWLYIRAWYERWVRIAREQVRHADGRIVPGVSYLRSNIRR